MAKLLTVALFIGIIVMTGLDTAKDSFAANTDSLNAKYDAIAAATE